MSSNTHPSQTLLTEYAQGNLDDMLSIMVATHVKQCRACQDKVAQIEEQLALLALPSGENEIVISNEDVLAMLQDIPQTGQVPPQPQQHDTDTALNFQGRDFALPVAVQPLLSLSGPWTRVMNKLWRSPVTGHGLPYQIDFIYMEAGGEIPDHSHKGREYTLVIDGDFCDENGQYGPGDLIQKNGSEQHIPYSERGCLCLAAIDAPLHFESGFARLLNPFSNLFFKAEGNR